MPFLSLSLAQFSFMLILFQKIHYPPQLLRALFLNQHCAALYTYTVFLTHIFYSATHTFNNYTYKCYYTINMLPFRYTYISPRNTHVYFSNSYTKYFTKETPVSSTNILFRYTHISVIKKHISFLNTHI